MQRSEDSDGDLAAVGEGGPRGCTRGLSHEIASANGPSLRRSAPSLASAPDGGLA